VSQPATRAGYLVASALCFVAGAMASGELLHRLLGAPLRYQAAEGSVIGAFFLFVPFAVIAWLAAAVDEKTSRKKSAAFFAVFVCVLTALYFRGYWSYETAMLHRSWTAAALSLSFTPFWSIPVLVVAAIAAFVMRKASRSLPVEE